MFEKDSNSVGQNPSWEADNSSATQEILLILWNPKAHYRGPYTETSESSPHIHTLFL
jgi:hypothetical protein